VLFLEFLPVLSLLLISFAKEGSWTWELLPSAYTVENYTALLTQAGIFLPVRNSVSMGVLTVIASILVGTTAAVVITKGRFSRFRGILDPLLTLSFAIPGTVVAIYLIVAFADPHWITGGQVLVGTFWILPLAYFIRLYPLVLRSVSSSLDRLEDPVLEAAEMFGAGPGRILRKVILPVIMPGIVAGSLLVMISALGEFPTSILLYTHANRPISVEILSQLRGYNFGSAGAYSVGLLVLVLLLSFISERLGGGPKEKGNGFHF
jgi:iron(III) transport system permease protein